MSTEGSKIPRRPAGRAWGTAQKLKSFANFLVASQARRPYLLGSFAIPFGGLYFLTFMTSMMMICKHSLCFSSEESTVESPKNGFNDVVLATMHYCLQGLALQDSDFGR